MTALRPDVPVAVTVLRNGEGIPLPAYASLGAAGMDLVAALETPLTLKPGERAAVPTGIALALPEGYEAQVRPRSGLALKHGVTVLNSPGTIDADYRGEIRVILANLGTEAVTLKRGERVAQLVLAPVSRIAWAPVEALPASARGARGFGSTGR
jgi:dUTP pyrophosphatase